MFFSPQPFSILIIVLVATLVGSFLVFKIKTTEREMQETFLAQITVNNSKDNNRSATLMFVGDIMLNRGVGHMIEKYGRGDYRFPFLKIVDDLKGADILFGNLESVISDKGVKVGSIYSFRAEPEAIEGLEFGGFDILSVANNHIFDFGREAMEDSFKRLKEAGIDFIGGGFSENEAYLGVIKKIKGIKIAFLAYTNLGSPYWKATEERSGIAFVDWTNLEEIKRDIKETKKQADILIVSLHAGEEYSSEPTSFQTEFSKACIDAGADLVIGHHPHVIQPIVKYKQGYIAYSLGNFIFDQGFSEETMKGLLLEVLIENCRIKEVVLKDIKINRYFQPELVENE